MSNVPFDVIDGYDRRKHSGTVRVRHFTLEELKNLPQWSHQWFMCGDGKVRRILITKVKTWKRKPNEVEIHGKYGLYEYVNWGTELSLQLLLKEVL